MTGNKNFIFHNPDKMCTEDVLEILNSNNYQLISTVLLATVFHEKDVNFCMNIIKASFKSENSSVRGTAVLCVGHLARINRAISEKFAIDILQSAFCDNNKFVIEQAENALDDIEIFVPSVAKRIKMKLGLI